jgi:FSR family fosmidomycin resistance protein-like MFS transporter
MVLVLLIIEFLDEFIYGAREVAWPLIGADLALSYTQIGLLLSLPSVIGNLVELSIGVLADVWKRRALIIGGGIAFSVALLLVAYSRDFPLLLAAFILLSPASGAFVSLSQATLMDIDPGRHEQNMARWTFAGSVGVVIGPLALGVAINLGWEWRDLFLLSAGLALILVLLAWRMPIKSPRQGKGEASFKQGVMDALQALRRREVLRWLTLLEFSDLMMDVLFGFLALYFVHIVGTTPTQAAMAVAVWTTSALVGDLALIPLLERVRGLRYLRLSAGLELVLFAAFLLSPILWVKIGLLALLGLFNAGWYSIPQAQLYSAMPGQSGSVMTVGNIFGFVGGLIPLGLGLIADRLDLQVAMWLLLLGPIALIVGIPLGSKNYDR